MALHYLNLTILTWIPSFTQPVRAQQQQSEKRPFELPILYFRDDLFLLFYTADYNKVKALMPSDKLHP
ncbi:MAG: hypothetical protein DRH06_04275, partial [Deltaproteobacteria bacterium]